MKTKFVEKASASDIQNSNQTETPRNSESNQTGKDLNRNHCYVKNKTRYAKSDIDKIPVTMEFTDLPRSWKNLGKILARRSCKVAIKL